MISQDKLDSFSSVLKNVTYSISIQVGLSNFNENNSTKIVSLLQQLLDSWNEVYDPTDLFYSKSMHNIYGLYVKAKKNGEINQAEKYLDIYKTLKDEKQRYAPTNFLEESKNNG